MTDRAKLAAAAVLIASGCWMIRMPETHAAPDASEPEPPCGLDSVVCEGEEDRTVDVTAYNSLPGQTDDTPCISGDGSDICRMRMEGETVCASNDWPLGAQIGLTGGVNGRCVVRDRMNARYAGTGRVDVYMGMDVKRAREFGIRKAVVKGL